MVIRPVPPLHRHRRRRREEGRSFILHSDLGATILGMISTHSLSAFTPAIDRTAPAQPPREAAPDRPVQAAAPAAAQRSLDAVPAQPARPLPRGSLLDLRV